MPTPTTCRFPRVPTTTLIPSTTTCGVVPLSAATEDPRNEPLDDARVMTKNPEDTPDTPDVYRD